MFLLNNFDHLLEDNIRFLKRYKKHQHIAFSTIMQLRKISYTWYKYINPNSIIIQNYCLRDTFSKKPKFAKTIYKLVHKLSYGGLIWAEGYSLWKITKEFLLMWLAEISMNAVDFPKDFYDLIDRIDSGFCSTSYRRKGKLYPAPFGTLIDEPLENYLQDYPLADPLMNIPSEVVISVAIVQKIHTKKNVVYLISPRPIGLNIHIPAKAQKVQVVEGIPFFRWYHNEESKYMLPMDKFVDIFNIDRIKSLLRRI